MLDAIELLRVVRRYGATEHPDAHLSIRERCIKYKSTMDDLTVPSGSWKANYEASSRAYNMFLAGTTLFMVCSYAFLFNSGVIYAHDPPPAKNPKKASA